MRVSVACLSNCSDSLLSPWQLPISAATNITADVVVWYMIILICDPLVLSSFPHNRSSIITFTNAQLEHNIFHIISNKKMMCYPSYFFVWNKYKLRLHTYSTLLRYMCQYRDFDLRSAHVVLYISITNIMT